MVLFSRVWLLAIGYWLLAIGYWLLAIGGIVIRHLPYSNSHIPLPSPYCFTVTSGPNVSTTYCFCAATVVFNNERDNGSAASFNR